MRQSILELPRFLYAEEANAPVAAARSSKRDRALSAGAAALLSSAATATCRA